MSQNTLTRTDKVVQHFEQKTSHPKPRKKAKIQPLPLQQVQISFQFVFLSEPDKTLTYNLTQAEIIPENTRIDTHNIVLTFNSKMLLVPAKPIL